jgi:hypothetical protein
MENPISLNTLESFPFRDDFCQVWLKLAQWFCRKRSLNCPTPFSHFCDYLPFEEDRWTDAGQRVMRKAHFKLSSGELKTSFVSYMSHKICMITIVTCNLQTLLMDAETVVRILYGRLYKQ